MKIYTVSQKKMSLAITLAKSILIIFGRNVIEKVSSQNMLYFPISCN